MTRHAARLLAFAAAVGCAGVVAAQAPFRGSVDLVSLSVTVTEAGHYVTNLDETTATGAYGLVSLRARAHF